MEIAVGFLAAYLGRKAQGLVGRAGREIDAAFDQKLSEFYGWVKGKLTGRSSAERSLRLLEKDPDGVDEQEQVGEELGATFAGDASGEAELSEWIAELKRLRPPGVRIRGIAEAGTVAEGAFQAGVRAEGPLAEGSEVTGEAKAGEVAGTNIGVEYDGSGGS
jgi:hypothetical protein